MHMYMYGAYTYKSICTCMERIHINVLLKKGDPLRFYITLWLHTVPTHQRETDHPAFAKSPWTTNPDFSVSSQLHDSVRTGRVLKLYKK